VTRLRKMWAPIAVKLLCGAIVTNAYADKPVGPPPPPFEVLATFPSEGAPGSNPVGSLVQGIDGNFYGVTSSGGDSGLGTIFSVAPDGVLTMLHSFSGTDGYNLTAGLVLGTDGNFYGTAENGGTVISGMCDSTGGETPGICGTIFRITPDGDFTVIYNFNGTDGAYPASGLVQGFDGNFYGTTIGGGKYGMGTVFTISSSGALTTIYNFCGSSGCPGGTAPSPGPLVQGTDGNFYGTTINGGAGNSNCLTPLGTLQGCGTVFRVTPGGTFTTLHTFCQVWPCPDGAEPMTGVVLGPDGAFYGTTLGGGAAGAGTVFRITSAGAITTLHSFCTQTNCADGGQPDSLEVGSDGNFYGTTVNDGGTSLTDAGTLFQLTPAGVLTPLHVFNYTTDGTGGLGVTQSTNGILFGLAPDVSGFGGGNVFTYDEGLNPFVQVLPMGGNEGTPVTIFGTALEGTSSVKFNGESASWDLVSDQEVQATVPAPATTGLVGLPIFGGLLGTLKTRVPFTTPVP
jgi:uncharacterized repeat protein (TIGR03803 family)